MLTAIIALIIVVLVFLLAGIRIVPQGMTMVIERLGKYRRTLESGINIIIPFFDRPRVVSWDMPSQDAKNNRKRTTHWMPYSISRLITQPMHAMKLRTSRKQ